MQAFPKLRRKFENSKHLSACQSLWRHFGSKTRHIFCRLRFGKTVFSQPCPAILRVWTASPWTCLMYSQALAQQHAQSCSPFVCWFWFGSQLWNPWRCRCPEQFCCTSGPQVIQVDWMMNSPEVLYVFGIAFKQICNGCLAHIGWDPWHWHWFTIYKNGVS